MQSWEGLEEGRGSNGSSPECGVSWHGRTLPLSPIPALLTKTSGSAEPSMECCGPVGAGREHDHVSLVHPAEKSFQAVSSSVVSHGRSG